jgi:hypothetical protein
MTEETFIQGMYRLGLQWRDHEMPEDAVALYRERLSRLSDREFGNAVNHCLDTCLWFPKISELLKAVADQGPTVIDTWNLLIAAAETGQKPELDAATEKALATIGGWEVFQYTSFDNLGYHFKDFRAALLEARARDNLALVGGKQAALPEPEG